jgi:hypothetical protein
MVGRASIAGLRYKEAAFHVVWSCKLGPKAQLSATGWLVSEVRALDSGAVLARGPNSANSVTRPFTGFEQGKRH